MKDEERLNIAIDGLEEIRNVSENGNWIAAQCVAKETLNKIRKGGDANEPGPNRNTGHDTNTGGREGTEVDWDLILDVVKTGDDTRYGKDLCKAVLWLEAQQGILESSRTGLVALSADQGKEIKALKAQVDELEKRLPTDEQITTSLLKAAKNNLVEKQRYGGAAKIREVIKMLTGKPEPECTCKHLFDRAKQHIHEIDPNCPKCNPKPECTECGGEGVAGLDMTEEDPLRECEACKPKPDGEDLSDEMIRVSRLNQKHTGPEVVSKPDKQDAPDAPFDDVIGPAEVPQKGDLVWTPDGNGESCVEQYYDAVHRADCELVRPDQIDVVRMLKEGINNALFDLRNVKRGGPGERAQCTLRYYLRQIGDRVHIEREEK